MADELTAATHTQHEDPTADAAASVATYLTVAIAAAQAAVNRAAARTHTAADDQDGSGVEAARGVYAVMLARDKGRRAPAGLALAAWQAAAPWRDDVRDAATATRRAQDRLRVLHPQAMARYDAMRAGLDPVAAMREVAPLMADQIAQPPAGTDLVPHHGTSEAEAEADPAKTSPPQLTAETYAAAVRAALPDELATAVLADQAWPQLVKALHHAEQAGADPAVLLAEVAGRRELTSATSPAQVLTYRLGQPVDRKTARPADSPADQSAGKPADRPAGLLEDIDAARIGVPAGNAAATAAQSFPSRLNHGPAPRREAEVDLAAASAGEVLAREANALADAGRDTAATPDDVSTPPVKEQHEGLLAALPPETRYAADHTRAQALLTQADHSPPSPRANVMPVFSSPVSPQAATAAQSFPFGMDHPLTASARTASSTSAGRTPNRIDSHTQSTHQR